MTLFVFLALLVLAALLAVDTRAGAQPARKYSSDLVLLALTIGFVILHLGLWWHLTRSPRVLNAAEVHFLPPVIPSDPRVGFLIYTLDFVALLTAIVRFGGLGVRKAPAYATILALAASFIGLLLVLWWFATSGARVEERLVAPLILPSPLEVLRAFPSLHFDQALVRNALMSFERVTIGFALAVLVAVPLGTYMATFPPMAAFFRLVALIGSYVPIVVFVPLTIAWFGATEMQKTSFLFIVCFVALLPLVVKTIDDVPAAYLDVAVTKGASQWQLVRHVLFPVAKADIWDHLRGVYGVGWTWIILAEVWANADQGLGYLLDISNRRGHIDKVFGVAIVIVVIAVLCDQAWRMSGRLLFPYKQTS